MRGVMAGIGIILLGCGAPLWAAERGQLSPSTTKEAQALVEQAMGTEWFFVGTTTAEELKAKVELVFTGSLADEIYQRSLPYLNRPTAWPEMEVKHIKLNRQGDGIAASVDYIRTEPEGDPDSGLRKATFHLRRTKSGWRIDQQKYLEQKNAGRDVNGKEGSILNTPE
jgi:hypothetical protein